MAEFTLNSMSIALAALVIAILDNFARSNVGVDTPGPIVFVTACFVAAGFIALRRKYEPN